MKEYRVRTSCEVLGVWRNGGSIIILSDLQAEELAPPFGNVVSLVEAENAEVADARVHRDKRQNGRTTERLGTHAAVDPQNPDD